MKRVLSKLDICNKKSLILPIFLLKFIKISKSSANIKSFKQASLKIGLFIGKISELLMFFNSLQKGSKRLFRNKRWKKMNGNA